MGMAFINSARSDTSNVGSPWITYYCHPKTKGSQRV
jgi:hypothetical protein